MMKVSRLGRMGRKTAAMLVCALCVAYASPSSGAVDPFDITAVVRTNLVPPVLTVTFIVPPHHYIYADQISVERPDGTGIQAVKMPEGHRKHDPFLDAETVTYDRTTAIDYALDPKLPVPVTVKVSYQGCSTSVCYRPVSHEISLVSAPAPIPAKVPSQNTPSPGWRMLANRFEVASHATGYLPAKDFLSMLDTAESGAQHGPDPLRDAFARGGILLLVLVVIVGGLGLNLTPCVLPMIPVNLSIIGAGSQGGSRLRGFALGAAYGLGTALAYGALGVVTVISGARFGSLNASPWFNFSIAAIFAVMSLAMFNVFLVDFSRFHGVAASSRGRGRFATAFFFGAIAAILAGACVAPILISVIVFSADFYSRGYSIALLLPFFLGLGMGLPWPFAGAGFALLPKPGQWMEKVKYVFGVVVLAFALLYGYYGVRGLMPARTTASHEGWMTSFEDALKAAEEQKKPLFMDFWATWCKNCVQMDRTTFINPEVVKRLDPYVRLRFQAENLKDPEINAVLDRYEVIGLPTYLILKPVQTRDIRR